jgi:hypothetical protein
MADSKQTVEPAVGLNDGTHTRDSRGEWMPRILGKALPFAWPIQPRKLLRFFLGFPGFLWPFGAAAFYGLAALTWQYLRCYQRGFQSPDLDRFASQGALFNTAYCASPACSPDLRVR